MKRNILKAWSCMIADRRWWYSRWCMISVVQELGRVTGSVVVVVESSEASPVESSSSSSSSAEGGKDGKVICTLLSLSSEESPLPPPPPPPPPRSTSRPINRKSILVIACIFLSIIYRQSSYLRYNKQVMSDVSS